MENLQVFTSSEFGEIRTIERENGIWFVGRDIAAALGYSNTKDALARHVDTEDKYQGEGVAFPDPNGVLKYPTIINESGLYSLVLSSKLPGAKKFKRWVTGEVLPSIRKHGAYMTPATLEKVLADPDAAIRILQEMKADRARVKELEAKAEQDRPKVLFADAVSVSNSAILIGDLAKILRQNGIEMGQTRLFQWLRENGYLIKQKGSGYNMPTQRSMELGLFKIKETCVTHSDGHTTLSRTPKVTGKGQVYLVNKILERKIEQPQLKA